jgi:hypothetical protein
MYKIIGADENEYGPVSAEVVVQWIEQGRANGQTKAMPEGATDWKPLSELPEFAAALVAASASPAMPPGPAPTPGPISPPSTPRPSPQTNSLAVTGLILGILSLTFGLCCCYGLPFSLAGLACSSVALSQMKSDPQAPGRNMAMAGLVLAIVSLLLAALFWALGMAFRTPHVFHRFHRL